MGGIDNPDEVGGGTPGGSPNDIQYNAAGVFGGITLSDGQIIIGHTGAAPTAGSPTVAVSGITGLGTGVATALAVNVGTAGSPVVNGGSLGTPSSGTATNLSGTATALNIGGNAATATTATTASAVAVSGITGLGTGVATALAVNVGTAGAPVINGGALGTPSSGTATNLTGTATALNIGGNAATATTATTSTTATNATNTAITEDTTTNATMYPTWVTANTGNLPQKTTSTKLSFNPSTGVLSSTSFTGAGTGLTGTASSLTAGTASAVAVGGITGLGTGVAGALATNVGSAGAPVLFNGAGGTPSSMTATNLSGTAASLNIGGTAATASAVAVGGITGLGTGVAAGLATNVGSAGAPVLFNGAGGTPSSMTATNLSGTAASLTAGTASAVAASGITGTTLASGVTASSLTSTGALTPGGNLTMSTHDIVTDTTTGTKFGTATTQKIGFYNSTPIVQPTGAVLTALSNLGLVGTPTLAASALSNGVTGTGAVALADSPVFTTTITSPKIYGGSAVGSTLSLVSTSATGSGDQVNILVGTNGGTTAASFQNTGTVFFNNVGTTASAANAFLNNGAANQLLRSTSSIRYKCDVETMDLSYAKAFLDKARPVFYRSKCESDNPDWSYWGFIAEELAEIDPRLVHWTKDPALMGDLAGKSDPESLEAAKKIPMVPDGAQYERVTVFLTALVKDLYQRIEALEQKGK